jgi:hypothetical protein
MLALLLTWLLLTWLLLTWLGHGGIVASGGGQPGHP